jgi:fructan beta-fructosidase
MSQSLSAADPVHGGAVAAGFMHLAVQTGATMRRVRLEVDGRTVREFDIELAVQTPDFWADVDLSPWRGRMLAVHVDPPDDAIRVRQCLAFSDRPRQETACDQPLRPQFHFSAPTGWLNDPNGLVFHDGVYHLYYQHNPYGWKWGNMHWGHATSADLVRWTHQPLAIYPCRHGDWAYSGSAVVDTADTAGFQRGDAPPIVIAYTSTGRGECIAFSNDGGRTFSEYPGNPVVRHTGRDPRLLWFEPGRHWVMAVYSQRDGRDGIAIHTSPDLKQWTAQSWIPGFYECPDLFPLPVDPPDDPQAGDPRALPDVRWVLHGADGNYVLGRFDGKVFTPQTDRIPLSYSDAWYAAQTYSHAPGSPARRLQIAWARSETRGMPFNQCMFFPTELTLRTTPDGVRLCANPVPAIESLRRKTHRIAPGAYDIRSNPLAGIEGELLDIVAELPIGDVDAISFNLRGVAVVYNHRRGLLSCDGWAAPLRPVQGLLRLRILVDRTTVEVFANDGQVYLPTAACPVPGDRSLSLRARRSDLVVKHLEIHELESAWR